MGYTETQWGADWEGGFHRNKEVKVFSGGLDMEFEEAGLDFILYS
jgi:hypothetical protein